MAKPPPQKKLAPKTLAKSKCNKNEKKEITNHPPPCYENHLKNGWGSFQHADIKWMWTRPLLEGLQCWLDCS